MSLNLLENILVLHNKLVHCVLRLLFTFLCLSLFDVIVNYILE